MTSSLLTFAAHLSVAHHIPGRIRLKLAASAGTAPKEAVEEAMRFSRTVTEVPGIRSVSLNPLARSCVVEYDPARIPPRAWQDLIDGAVSDASAALLDALAAPARRAAE